MNLQCISSSVITFAALITLFAIEGSLENVAILFAALLLPLACVWWPDELGTVTGISLGLLQPRVSETSPGVFVSIGGWIMLLAVIATTTYYAFARQQL